MKSSLKGIRVLYQDCGGRHLVKGTINLATSRRPWAVVIVCLAVVTVVGIQVAILVGERRRFGQSPRPQVPPAPQVAGPEPLRVDPQGGIEASAAAFRAALSLPNPQDAFDQASVILVDLSDDELRKMSVPPGLFGQPELLKTALERGMQIGSIDRSESNLLHDFARLSVADWDNENYRLALAAALNRPEAASLLMMTDAADKGRTPLFAALFSPTFLQFPSQSPFDMILAKRDRIPGREIIYCAKVQDDLSVPEVVLKTSMEALIGNPHLLSATLRRVAESLSRLTDLPDHQEIIPGVLKCFLLGSFSADLKDPIFTSLQRIEACYAEVGLKKVNPQTGKTPFEEALSTPAALGKWTEVFRNVTTYEQLVLTAAAVFHPLPISTATLTEECIARWENADKQGIQVALDRAAEVLVHQGQMATQEADYTRYAYHPALENPKQLYGMPGNPLLV